jgi:hypothetical protein
VANPKSTLPTAHGCMRRFDVARKRNSDPNSDSQGRPKHNFQHSRPFFDRRRREWDSDRGLRLKDSDEIDPENIGAVAEIEESRVVDKKGHDVVTIKIKQHSRHQALQDGGRASGNQRAGRPYWR